MSGVIEVTKKVILTDFINWKTWLHVVKSSAENGKYNV